MQTRISGRILFVTNVPPSMGEGAIRKMFSENCGSGTVTNVKLMIDFETRCSRGFCFVSVDSNATALDTVRRLNGKFPLHGPEGTKIYNERVGNAVVPLGVCFSNRPDSPEARASTKLYVRNLPLDVKEQQLTDVFSEFGELCDVKIMRNDMSVATKRTVAFVRFKEVKGAQAALEKAQDSTAAFGPEFPLAIRFGYDEGERRRMSDRSSNNSNTPPTNNSFESSQASLPLPSYKNTAEQQHPMFNQPQPMMTKPPSYLPMQQQQQPVMTPQQPPVMPYRPVVLPQQPQQQPGNVIYIVSNDTTTTPQYQQQASHQQFPMMLPPQQQPRLMPQQSQSPIILVIQNDSSAENGAIGSF